MPSWEETRTHMRETFVLTGDEEKFVTLGWKFKDKDGAENVFQRQRVELVQAFGQPHLLVMCDICPAERIPERVMLTHNLSLAVGAIALLEGLYVMRVVLSLEGLAFPELDRTLAYTAHEAARLRENAPA